MRGNPYARGGDPMKSKALKRKEKRAKLATTGRVKRLNNRLRGIRQRSDKREGNHHMTALMESYVVRRKTERSAANAKEGAEKNNKATSATAVLPTTSTAPPTQQQERGASTKPAAEANRNSSGKRKVATPMSTRAPVSRSLY